MNKPRLHRRLDIPLPALRVATVALCVGGSAGGALAQADVPALAEPLAGQVRQLILEKVSGPGAPRVDIVLGRLDPRLKLAACQRVDAYLPGGARLWGATRVGLRCAEGVAQWNVYLPVTVNVYGPAWVAAAPLPAGHVLAAGDLRQAEVNLSESRSAAVTDGAAVVGRVLGKALTAGQAVRDDTLKSRQWFAPGDTVQLRAVGGGFAISGSGQALSAGMEGQNARVRTESGKVISGRPVGDRVVEITL